MFIPESLHVSSTHVLIIRRINCINIKYVYSRFYVLLTVHLGIILVNEQLDAQFFFMYVYSKSLHVSSTHVLIIRRINTLNPELNPICYLLALLAHRFLHVSRIRVKSLTLRLLMSYIYIWSAYS